ncbi:hypothetical protein ACIP5Y_42565 [Nocardia sp. NPDC088792]|uniref:hypothetical protein n=1 Tax=Nocardia sp. NPDC088792 TaxID=3364332 RepID=UPI00380D5120
MDDPIAFDHEQMVHLDSGTYHWVSLKAFRITADRPDTELLAALVRHPQYRDNYAGGGPDDQSSPSLHGPYLLDRISADSFNHLSPGTAQTLLQQWADRASGTVSVAVQDELNRWVYPVLTDSVVFELPDLTHDAEHDWGWIVGAINGFHELVAIDRPSRVMTLVVASDD